MHNQTITAVALFLLGICALIVMGCTVWFLFTGRSAEFLTGLLGCALCIYAFIDVSRDYEKGL